MRFARIWLRLVEAYEMQAVIDAPESEKELVALVVKRRTRSRRLVRVLFVLLVLWLPLAWIAARGLIVSAPLAHADALVVLGGSATYVERTREAAQIFSEGRARKIILTNDGQQGGWSQEERRNPLFIERAAKELENAGVPTDKIEALPYLVSGTYDEAVLLREYAVKNGLRSLLVVTSAYHSRRALWVFRRVFAGSGIEVGIESPATNLQTPSAATWWLHLKGWSLVAGEYVKLVYYRLTY